MKSSEALKVVESLEIKLATLRARKYTENYDFDLWLKVRDKEEKRLVWAINDISADHYLDWET